MDTNLQNINLEQQFKHTFISQLESSNHPSAYIQKLKKRAFTLFEENGFPSPKQEKWRNTNLQKLLTDDYVIPEEVHSAKHVELDEILKCEIDDLVTETITILNGWCYEEKLRTYDNGIIVGSIKSAIKERPDLIEPYLGKLVDIKQDGLKALNTAFFHDGVLIYIPDGVKADKTFQIVNICKTESKLFIQPRNLIILGKEAEASILHCDDSLNQQKNFSNAVSEIFLDEKASLLHYKLQNINDDSVFINSFSAEVKEKASIKSFQVSFNGNTLRNDIDVNLAGEHATASVSGLYLMDKNQHIDNQVYIKHSKPNGTSNQVFKGVLDDYASASFNGHIYVARDAQHTLAMQNSRNLLLTDKTKVDAQPFLEIYADDVKCSHGATVGQLNEEALFYIRSRGVDERNAKLLLMYAFAAEVIKDIPIETLKIKIEDMIKQRLRGELNICSQCVLHCHDGDNQPTFAIDLNKL